LFRDAPSTDDQHSDGEEGSGRCWFTPRGRGRWRFARLQGKQSRWRVSPLTRSPSTVGRDVEGSCCCCCGPRWRWNSECVDGAGDGNGAAAREGRGRSGNLLRKFASFNDSSASLRFSDGGRVSPALSPLPVRTMPKDKERQAFVPLWQRRASMSPIKALDLRYRTS
jgi:hypothetical protein